ncbi:MAG: Obg family GTPase CgtA, partial [Dehalococcoidia bacterium]
TRSRHPDGGKGGRGADIIFRVDRNIQGLQHLRFNQHFRAEKGKCGQANKKKGADGRPCIIKVPAGTIVRDLENNLFLQDLLDPEEELVAAQGGAGGKANTRIRPATSGLPGEQKHLILDLKLIADIGIIGYPNAGKSTFVGKITSARPNVAAYAFTTISPSLGILQFLDFGEPSRLTVVEIPGLIKGSHQGKGLGAQFLRHAERTKVLIHLIDMAAGEGRKPLEDYYSLNHELESYNPELASKCQILVANKMDLPEAKAHLASFSLKIKKTIYPISAKTGEGIENFLNDLRRYFQKG